MKFKPLRNLVLVQDNNPGDKMVNGILLPKMFNDSVTSREVTVISAGPGSYTEDGKYIPMQVEAGQVVIIGTEVGQEQEVDGKDYILISETDILGILS